MRGKGVSLSRSQNIRTSGSTKQRMDSLKSHNDADRIPKHIQRDALGPCGKRGAENSHLEAFMSARCYNLLHLGEELLI